MNKKYYFSVKGVNGAFLNSEFVYSKNKLIQFIRDIKLKEKYEEIETPVFVSSDVFKKTGHLDYFFDNMFSFEKYFLKPMSCPGAALYLKNVFLNNQDIFPKRIFEFGSVFRKEKSGSCSLLTRCLNFTQDDSHVFCKNEEQVLFEVKNIFKKYLLFYELLNWNVSIYLSLPEKRSFFNKDHSHIVSFAEKILTELSFENKINFSILKDEGAFYGPKIDFFLDDKVQLSTIQIDYFLSKNLNVKFFNKDNSSFHPITIHTAMLGSIERFMYFFLKKNRNIFPFWCSKLPFVICKLFPSKSKLEEKIINFLERNKINYLLKDKIINVLKENSNSIILIIGREEEKNDQVRIAGIEQEQINLNINDFFKYLDDKIILINRIING